MHKPQAETPKQKILNKLSIFIQHNRTFLLVVLITIIVGVITFAVVSEIIGKRAGDSTYMVEQVQKDYESWSIEESEEQKQELENFILDRTEEIITTYPRLYAAQRAHFIRGNLFFEKEMWEESVAEFVLLADTFPRSYLAPISLVNAAVALEENGSPDKAIEFYQRISDTYRDTFVGIPEALFSLGRMHEQQNDYAAAQEVYEDLEDNFSSSNWTKLARNRIIKMKVDGKI
jgi:tetratricopeptide (TPR) repeat protein